MLQTNTFYPYSASPYLQLITNFVFFLFLSLSLVLPPSFSYSAGSLVPTERHAGTIGYAPVNTDYFYYPLQPKLLPHISSMFVLLFCAAFLHLSYSLVCVCVYSLVLCLSTYTYNSSFSPYMSPF